MSLKNKILLTFIGFATITAFAAGWLQRSVYAEGTHQFNIEQSLESNTEVYADVLNIGETINISFCNDSNIAIFDVNGTPADTGDDINVVSTFITANLSCSLTTMPNPITGAYKYTPSSTGTYRIIFDTGQSRYDFSVTSNNSIDPDPTLTSGQIWSYLWDMDGCGFELQCATDIDLYALAPAPLNGEYFVWKLDLNRFSGASYELVANSIGLDPPYSGLSAPRSGTTVTPEYPIYLGYPAIATAQNTSVTTITNARFIDDANEDNIFSPNATPGVQDVGNFEFTSNVANANYAITIDTNQDNTFGTGDRILLGNAVQGLNTVQWDGNYPNGSPVPVGIYKARIQIRIGEFHFVATDVETSGGIDNVNGSETEYTRGLTIYRALSPTLDQPTTVYWDTLTEFGSYPEAESNLPNGILSGTMTDGNGNGLPDGFHTWGDFDGGGVGNTNRLDTYTYAESDSEEVLIAVASGEAADTDGVSASMELVAINNGDGNGDGIADFLQSDVTSLTNPVTNLPTTIQVENCPSLSAVNIFSESQLASQDSSYDYPFGLKDFTITCLAPGGTANITIFYDKVYDTSGWTLRKFINGSYGLVGNAVFGTTLVGGVQVTTISYSLTDGGNLDADGAVNGVIVDPVGPGVTSTASVGAPNTGLKTSINYAYVLTLIGIAFIALSRRARESK